MDWWVTPSGTTVRINIGTEFSIPNHDAVGYSVTATSTGGITREVEVAFVTPHLIDVARRHRGEPPLDPGNRSELAIISALRAVDSDPDFFEPQDDTPITIGPGDDAEIADRPSLSDQGLRRYLTRRLYLAWKHGSLNEAVEFSDVDAALTGCGPTDFLRNLQLLEQEGYVTLDQTHDPGFAGFDATPTSALVRAVERYGAAPEDVETAEDYLELVGAIPSLAQDEKAIRLDRGRFETARTPEEIESVFRSVMPLLEGTVQRLLQAHGSQRQHTSLGSMIGELKNRGIGGVSLTSQLTAVKTNARDISLHGGEIPTSVLRIATETCFALLPQLGRLFP